MLESLDRIISEVGIRFNQRHNLAEKFGFLTPSNLFDESFNGNLEAHRRDIDVIEFAVERKRLQSLVASVHASERNVMSRGGSRATPVRSEASSRRVRP